MSLLHRPRRAKRLRTARRDLDVGSPATKPRFLVDMPGEIFNEIYELLSMDVTKVHITKTGNFTCPFPLASTCKKFRQQLCGYIEKHPPIALTSYNAQIVDFRFGHLKSLIRKNLNFKSSANLVWVEVHHSITTSTIDNKEFLSWTNFVAANYNKLATIHRVMDMPTPEARVDFIRNLNYAFSDLTGSRKTAEIGQIRGTFLQWWGRGLAKYDGIPAASIKKMKVDLPAYLDAIKELRDLDREQEPPREELSGNLDINMLKEEDETEPDDTDDEMDDVGEAQMAARV